MPTTDPGALFGRLVTRRDVEIAIVSFLETWVPTYVGEIERQGGLEPRTIPMPPDPSLSYRGGLDFNTWEASWTPTFIVNAQPFGAPMRVDASGTYVQEFELAVGVNVQYSGATMPSLGPLEEDSARGYADMLGMAACAAMLQHGGLGAWPDGSSVSYDTWMVEYPRTVFPFPDERRVCRAQFVVNAMIANVVTAAAGPRTPAQNPYAAPGDLTVVDAVGIEVDAFPIADDLSAPAVTGLDGGPAAGGVVDSYDGGTPPAQPDTDIDGGTP